VGAVSKEWFDITDLPVPFGDGLAMVISNHIIENSVQTDTPVAQFSRTDDGEVDVNILGKLYANGSQILNSVLVDNTTITGNGVTIALSATGGGADLPYIACDEEQVLTTISSDLIVSGNLTLADGGYLTLNSQTISEWSDLSSYIPGGGVSLDDVQADIVTRGIFYEKFTLGPSGNILVNIPMTISSDISAWTAEADVVKLRLASDEVNFFTLGTFRDEKLHFQLGGNMSGTALDIGVDDTTGASTITMNGAMSLNNQSISQWSDLSSYLPGVSLPYITCNESTVRTTISSALTVTGSTSVSELRLPNTGAGNTVVMSTSNSPPGYLTFTIGDANLGSMMDYIRGPAPIYQSYMNINSDLTVALAKKLTLNGQTIAQWSDLSQSVDEEYYSKTQVDQMMTDLRAEMAATYALKQ
jgi:hypothetical protein